MNKFYIPVLNNSMMKNFTLRFARRLGFFALNAVCLLSALKSNAQSSATWNLTTSLTPVVCGSVTATAPSAGSNVSAITGPVAVSGYSGTNFGNFVTVANKYFQYSITNTSAAAITVTNVNFSTYYNGTTYADFDFRYSTDNFVTTNTLLYSTVQANVGSFGFNGTASISVPATKTLS